MDIDVIVLAAGKGTRMYSDLPKVLHPLAGVPMLTHVLRAANQLEPRNIYVVTGYQAEQVGAHYQDTVEFGSLKWVKQSEQLGTGHAVMQAMPQIDDHGLVLVLYGDVPLIKPTTLQLLTRLASGQGIAVLTLDTPQPHGLGRIIRDEQGHVSAIVEEKDASTEQRHITEINSGIMAFQASALRNWLSRLTTQNAQGEYYLTDTVELANQDGFQVAALTTEDSSEVQGVNNRLQLAELERNVQLAQAREIAMRGTTVMDPARLDIRGTLALGRDVSIDINTVFDGHNEIGHGVSIGPNVYIKNCIIGEHTQIQANSHLEGVVIADNCQIGPFARLRPGTELRSESKIGNFVETKKSVIGTGSKVNHLSYIGDAELGDNVNVGAGTITCNYDGVNKFRTIIKDGVFVGSNTSLVAPVTVGKNATIGAGSVITTQVPDEQLAVARGRQKNISGWKRPIKK
ncbi:bifunctional UDP-N-acetylglucosamine diphosphorylase/glucosamine-1-phosphate N-acetyltransferase GlmU [Pseudohongiella spirulinae]|uniref:Bifunctional protein GlmU n=1 Tax=Pseudohongiella spirulinae TaxID=1249552 RepID=A0A0S2KHZ8_9GAMM|nr:bifunctional UDP-N-acetylglucosamine diphosphorylase/glucosamine-1-phosphate N-acetyltransferase GlmU [Pseudohongiella spirulinae]ALO47668.1 Bifunctional protein GlmU [Pseudohongiella spirulinae]